MAKGMMEVKKGIMVDLEELASFLVEAKRSTYASKGAANAAPQRPYFRELAYGSGDWEYRDSYSGSRYAPGQEYVRFRGLPVWAMGYSGGMVPEYHRDVTFVHQTFAFLKDALSRVSESRPFRGPSSLIDGHWRYQDSSTGDITRFRGGESIFYNGVEVFSQDYSGQIIIHSLD